jgi:predicted amidohydrolase YtcJ
VSIFNSVSVTATQDAATMGAGLDVFTELDRADELNTWLRIETMVTRRSPDPSVSGTLAAGQAIDLDAAIRAHTVNPARAMGSDQEIGRIKTGFSADFILPDQNVFEVPAARIRATQVHKTSFAGRCVYDATARS